MFSLTNLYDATTSRVTKHKLKRKVFKFFFACCITSKLCILVIEKRNINCKNSLT